MSEDYTSNFDTIYWESGNARVTGFSTTGSRGVTTVTIKVDVKDPGTLGSIMRDLAELRDKPARPKRGDIA